MTPLSTPRRHTRAVQCWVHSSARQEVKMSGEVDVAACPFTLRKRLHSPWNRSLTGAQIYAARSGGRKNSCPFWFQNLDFPARS